VILDMFASRFASVDGTVLAEADNHPGPRPRV